MKFDRRSSRSWLAVVGLAGLVLAAPLGGAGRKFYDDDPIAREPETQNAAGVQEWEIDLPYDLALNLFTRPGDPRTNVRAGDVNTVDEVPDSSWFTNRILARPVSTEEAVRGPNSIDGPAPGRWTVIAAKAAGFAPGFTVRDEKNDVWFLSFDAAGYPEAATGAIAVASRLFWTLGYYQVESYLTTLNPGNLAIGDTARVRPFSGKRRPMGRRDIDAVLARANRSLDGSYRVVAGRAIPGKPIGGFRYYGTRPDDPNDIVPHEHRRVLRALKVFGAWTNLVDMKAGNTLDTLITDKGQSMVRHYLQDVGSTFGTGALGPREFDEGYEYLLETDLTWKRLFTFGFYLSPWQTVSYEDHEAIGRFEGDEFEPEKWRSRVPAAAVLRARDDDTFWAARRVIAFSDEMIRAIVKTGRYTDPAAEQYLADVLIKRRDKIARAYLVKVNPLVAFSLGTDGAMTFENAAVAAGVAPQPPSYRVAWSRFDNATGEAASIGGPVTAASTRVGAPPEIAGVSGEFVKADISAIDPPHPSWTAPVSVYFRRMAGGWKVVGVER